MTRQKVLLKKRKKILLLGEEMLASYFTRIITVIVHFKYHNLVNMQQFLIL